MEGPFTFEGFVMIGESADDLTATVSISYSIADGDIEDISCMLEGEDIYYDLTPIEANNVYEQACDDKDKRGRAGAGSLHHASNRDIASERGVQYYDQLKDER